MNVEDKYGDILYLPHHVSSKHPRMSLYDRAAQFSPFAALTGHDEAIEETARLTEAFKELDESEKDLINEKLFRIATDKSFSSDVTFTFFKLDFLKDGGEYITVTDRVKKIDFSNREIITEGGIKIYIDDIRNLVLHTCDDVQP